MHSPHAAARSGARSSGWKRVKGSNLRQGSFDHHSPKQITAAMLIVFDTAMPPAICDSVGIVPPLSAKCMIPRVMPQKICAATTITNSSTAPPKAEKTVRAFRSDRRRCWGQGFARAHVVLLRLSSPDRQSNAPATTPFSIPRPAAARILPMRHSPSKPLTSAVNDPVLTLQSHPAQRPEDQASCPRGHARGQRQRTEEECSQKPAQSFGVLAAPAVEHARFVGRHAPGATLQQPPPPQRR